jgi:hypothetical protein
MIEASVVRTTRLPVSLETATWERPEPSLWQAAAVAQRVLVALAVVVIALASGLESQARSAVWS